VHDEEAAGDLAFGLCSLAVGRRRVTHTTMKERAERAETLKPDFETDIRYAQVVFTEQFLRFLNATMNEVLMWSLIERLPEQSQEVVTREAGLFGNLIETQRMVVTVIDKITCTTKPLKCFEIWKRVNSLDHNGYGFGGNGLCNAELMNSVNPASVLLCRNL